jgi:hypothetical protein
VKTRSRRRHRRRRWLAEAQSRGRRPPRNPGVRPALAFEALSPQGEAFDGNESAVAVHLQKSSRRSRE